MRRRKKHITLVLGGARSGKSRYAQGFASTFEHVTFIATARAGDAEMRRKIRRHRHERPPDWKTVEAPLNLQETIYAESGSADVLVVDCLTFYAFNLMSAGQRESGRDAYRKHIQELCDAMDASKASVIAVSNEVGSGIVPAYRSGRIYRDLLGHLNQAVARIADNVILMIAGVPLTVKNSSARVRHT
jgi:adenosylcobinamide kinase/adenosylcobinamide-phosphate guanylyltransferase